MKSVLGYTVKNVNFLKVRPLNSNLFKFFCNTSIYNETDSAYQIPIVVSCYSPDQSVSADVIKLNKLVQTVNAGLQHNRAHS